MKVAVVVPRLYAYVHAQCLLDLAVPLAEGLKANELDVEITDEDGAESTASFDRVVIVGPHIATRIPPDDAVIVNTEQVSLTSEWLSSQLLEFYRTHRVFDYDSTNTAALRRLDVDAVTVPPGYAPSMTRVEPANEKDIDVLFFGSVNERRRKILDELVERDLKVTHLFGMYGAERDAAVARAKIVLNLHAYESKIFEAARVAYLFANRAFVVSEESEYMPWQGGYVATPYDQLVDTCVEYLEKPDEQQRIAEAGFEIFSEHTAADAVRPVVAELLK